MRLPEGLGRALGQGVDRAIYSEDPQIAENYNRSNTLSNEAINVIKQLGNLSAPEPVRPAYRTEDLLGLLVGGLLSGGGREIPGLVAGYQQGKLGRAQQDTEVANQRFSQKVDSIQRQGSILGQQAGVARQTAEDLLRAQERKRETIERKRAAMATDETRRLEMEDRKRKVTLDNLVNQVKNLSMLAAKAPGPGQRKAAADAIQTLVDKNPEFADMLLTYRNPSDLAVPTPQELLINSKAETENTLRQGRLNLLTEQAKSLASGRNVNTARIAEIEERTRLMEPKLQAITQALSLRAITAEAYASNIQSLIEQRPLEFEKDFAATQVDILKQQLISNSGAIKAADALLKAAQKRMDAMKAQYGDTSEEYLEAVTEYNTHNTTKADLEDARTKLEKQVAGVGAAYEKTRTAQALQQAIERERLRKAGQTTPYTPGIDQGDPRGGAKPPRGPKDKPKTMPGDLKVDPRAKKPPKADALKSLQDRAGKDWVVTIK